MPRCPGLHLHGKGSNPSDVGKSSDPPDQVKSILEISLGFTRYPIREEDVGVHPLPSHHIQRFHQLVIGVEIALVSPSHPLGPHLWGEGHEGFGPGKGLGELPYQLRCRQSEGLVEAFHR